MVLTPDNQESWETGFFPEKEEVAADKSTAITLIPDPFFETEPPPHDVTVEISEVPLEALTEEDQLEIMVERALEKGETQIAENFPQSACTMLPPAIDDHSSTEFTLNNLPDLSSITPFPVTATKPLSLIPEDLSPSAGTMLSEAGNSSAVSAEGKTLVPPTGYCPEEIIEQASEFATYEPQDVTRIYNKRLSLLPEFMKTETYHEYEQALAQHHEETKSHRFDSNFRFSKPPSFWDYYQSWMKEREGQNE